ncbi:MAG: hypothetical protein L6Q29_04060 [Candidatus Pacebacteria bacterium]|nr:hypothetical protein [Candidatus Paceibacterota bacterium]
MQETEDIVTPKEIELLNIEIDRALLSHGFPVNFNSINEYINEAVDIALSDWGFSTYSDDIKHHKQREHIEKREYENNLFKNINKTITFFVLGFCLGILFYKIVASLF